MFKGAKKYTVNNWRKISRAENIRHCMAHLYAYMQGDTQECSCEEHLNHALTRLAFAKAIPEEPKRYPYIGIPDEEIYL
jgi:hypothetical protein